MELIVIPAKAGIHAFMSTKMNLIFRLARPEDGQALLQIHQSAVRTLAAGHYDAVTIESWLAGLTAEGYGLQMAKGERIEIAMDDRDAIVGFCGTRDNEVTGLFVHPTAAGQGIGTALLTRAMDWLRLQHDGVLTLSASLNSRSFYRKHGWKEVACLPQSTRGGLPMEAVEMTMDLDLGLRRDDNDVP